MNPEQHGFVLGGRSVLKVPQQVEHFPELFRLVMRNIDFECFGPLWIVGFWRLADCKIRHGVRNLANLSGKIPRGTMTHDLVDVGKLFAAQNGLSERGFAGFPALSGKQMVEA